MLLLVAASWVAACAGDDASSSESASSSASTSATGAVGGVTTSSDAAGAPSTTGVRPEGFDTAAVEIRRADGTICALCTYLARTADERQLGLMHVTDLAGHDGMIFEFEGAEPRRFWMKNTVMPLSAAWFAADGSFVGAFDMEPCPADADQCPTYGPGDAAQHVLEVPLGDLERLGIRAGSTLLTVGAPCTPADS